MNTSQLEGLEKQLKDAKALLEERQAVLRLDANRDFKRIIIDGFCEADCARFVRESTDTNLSPEMRADALGMAQAAGYLKRYLSAKFQMGATAEREIGEIELTLEEVRAEGDDHPIPAELGEDLA